MVRSLVEIQLHWLHVKSGLLEEGPCIAAKCVVNRWDEGCRRKGSRFQAGIKAPQLQRLCLNNKLYNSLDMGNR
jgi:hypothetical protein